MNNLTFFVGRALSNNPMATLRNTNIKVDVTRKAICLNKENPLGAFGESFQMPDILGTEKQIKYLNKLFGKTLPVYPRQMQINFHFNLKNGNFSDVLQKCTTEFGKIKKPFDSFKDIILVEKNDGVEVFGNAEASAKMPQDKIFDVLNAIFPNRE